jgi:hypothetical protein
LVTTSKSWFFNVFLFAPSAIAAEQALPEQVIVAAGCAGPPFFQE